MSNEQDRDKRVSATYRELARERTPEHLDRKILAMAAKAAPRPAYSRWISWSRPVAWAATITLCLALVLELARQPTVQPPASPAATTFKQTEAPEARQERELLAPNPAASDQDKAHVDAYTEDLIRYEAPAVEAASDQWSANDAELQQEVAESIANTAAAEKTGLARSTSRPASESFLSTEPAATTRKRSIAESSACPEDRRDSGQAWFACILELREAGENVLAERELQILIDTFPDFKTP